MTQAYGPSHRRGEPQPNRLPAAVADEGPLVRLPSRNVYRHPDKCPNELDLGVLGEPAPLELPADLLGHRFTTLKSGKHDVEIDVDIETAITSAAFREENSKAILPIVTDVFWPREDLYREGQAESTKRAEEDEGSDETE